MSHVSRRTFVQMSASLLAAPLAAEAQQRAMLLIGYLAAPSHQIRSVR